MRKEGIDGNKLLYLKTNGACRGTDPELFYSTDEKDRKSAMKICNSLCAVRDDCLDFALEFNEEFGIWGGKSERDRKRIKKMIQHPGKNTTVVNNLYERSVIK